MDILATVLQKGGVGKTTTAYHLIRAAQRADKRVLAIDMDPQGNLTTALTPERLPLDEVSLADVINPQQAPGEEPVTLADVIVATIWPGVDLAPTVGRALAIIEQELTQAPRTEDRARTLQRALQGVGERYDLVIIDCPPNLGMLTVNALVAAHGAVLVTEAGLFAADGVALMRDTIGSVQQHYNPDLTIRGVLLNKWEPATLAGREWRLTLQEALGEQLLDPPIPKRAVIRDAIETGDALDRIKGGQSMAELYTRHLAKITGR